MNEKQYGLRYGRKEGESQFTCVHFYHLTYGFDVVHVDAIQAYGDNAKRTIDAMINNHDVMVTATEHVVPDDMTYPSIYTEDVVTRARKNSSRKSDDTVNIGQACVEQIYAYKTSNGKIYERRVDAEYDVTVDTLVDKILNILPRDARDFCAEDLTQFLLGDRVLIDTFYSLTDKKKVR